MNTYLYRIKDGYVMIDTGYQNSYAKCTIVSNLVRNFDSEKSHISIMLR